MGRNSSRNSFAGKQRLGGSKPPKPPKRKKPAGGGGGGDSGGGSKKRSFWGLVAVGTSLAAFWAAALLQLRRTREQRLAKDRVTLGTLLRKPLEFTEHAKCRMGCRFISEREVVLALRGGAINHRKSEPRLYPCPKLVIDADVGGTLPGAGGVKQQTTKKKRVQVVCSDCLDSTNIVTVIDRDTDWPCYCP